VDVGTEEEKAREHGNLHSQAPCEHDDTPSASAVLAIAVGGKYKRSD
jgi:hypothetical protein